MVEFLPSKQAVAGSNPVSRSIRQDVIDKPFYAAIIATGTVAIDYDLRDILNDIRYPTVCNSGRVFAYLRE